MRQPDISRVSPDDRFIDFVSREWGMELESMAFPFLIEQNRCSILEIRSRTSRKAVLRSDGIAYFVKQVPWYAASLRQVENICDAQQVLARQYDVALPPLTTVCGAPYGMYEGEYYYVHRLSQNACYQGEDWQLQAAARALATAHNMIERSGSASLRCYFSLVIELLGEARQHAFGKSNDDTEQLFAMLAACVETASMTVRSAPDMRTTFVHGDFSPWNVLFTPDVSIARLIDFDNCDVGFPQRDLLEAVLTFCALRYENDSTNFATPFNIVVNPHKLELFVRSYVAMVADDWNADEVSACTAFAGTVFAEYVALGVLRGDVVLPRDLSCVSAAYQQMNYLGAAVSEAMNS